MRHLTILLVLAGPRQKAPTVDRYLCVDENRRAYMACITTPTPGVDPTEKFRECARRANAAEAECRKRHPRAGRGDGQ